MSLFQPERPDFGQSRREILRAGILGVSGIGVVASAGGQAAEPPPQAHPPLRNPNQTCPVWWMGSTQGANGDTIYTYYCYYLDANCNPDFATGSSLDSTGTLMTGCYGSCFDAHYGRPKPAARAGGPLTINHAYFNNLENRGLLDFHTTFNFPFSARAFDSTIKMKDKEIYVRLYAAEIKGVGPNADQNVVIALGREVPKPQPPPNGPASIEELAPESSLTPKHHVFRHDIPNREFSNVNFHTLLKTTP